jgi:hypothetical protein
MLSSFLEISPHNDFPIQNLPFGVVTVDETAKPEIVVAIGDHVLRLGSLVEKGYLHGSFASSLKEVWTDFFLADFLLAGLLFLTTSHWCPFVLGGRPISTHSCPLASRQGQRSEKL